MSMIVTTSAELFKQNHFFYQIKSEDILGQQKQCMLCCGYYCFLFIAVYRHNSLSEQVLFLFVNKLFELTLYYF